MNTSDPRVGSARDNSTAAGLSRVGQGSNSSSASSLVATLVPVLIWAAVCITLFLVLRRKCPRVYAPRALLQSLDPQYVPGPMSPPTTDLSKAKEVPRFQRDGSTGSRTSIAYLLPSY